MLIRKDVQNTMIKEQDAELHMFSYFCFKNKNPILSMSPQAQKITIHQ